MAADGVKEQEDSSLVAPLLPAPSFDYKDDAAALEKQVPLSCAVWFCILRIARCVLYAVSCM